MKMRNLLICLFLSGSLSGFSQVSKFEVKHNGQLLKDGAVVEVSNMETVGTDLKMYFKVEVKNTSSAAYRMTMKRETGSVMENTTNSLCWIECMGPNDDTANSGILGEKDNIVPGETQYPYGEIILNNGGEAVEGTSVLYYTFKTTSKGDAPLRIEVRYKYTKPVDPEPPVTQVEQVENPDALVIYSGQGYITINASKPQSVALFRADGTFVKSLQAPMGITVLSGLDKGIYLVSGQKVMVR